MMQVTTVEMRALAGRLETGAAASADMHLAGQLVLALMACFRRTRHCNFWEENHEPSYSEVFK
jgi:hypothetical protein